MSKNNQREKLSKMLKKKMKKPDRRIDKTRQLLREALIGLIIEKGYEKVTVQDIIDRANVGRATFYQHFSDKEDLLLTSLEVLQEAFTHSKATSNDGGSDFILQLFLHAESHRGIYRAMAGKSSGHIILKEIHAHIGAHVKRAVKEHGRLTLQTQEVAVQFIASSLVGVMTWWLDQNRPIPARELQRIYLELLGPILNGVNRNPP